MKVRAEGGAESSCGGTRRKRMKQLHVKEAMASQLTPDPQAGVRCSCYSLIVEQRDSGHTTTENF